MTVVQDHSINFKNLAKAFSNGDVALMECKVRKTREIVATICAVNYEKNGDYSFVPFAIMINGNPYDILDPPNPDGGFEDVLEDN